MAMETGSHDGPAETLPDPTTLTPQERVDRLVEAVESDDLLGVVLFLKFLEEGEINACSSSTAKSPLEAALGSHSSNPTFRRLILECLLHAGAAHGGAQDTAQARSDEVLLRIVQEWDDGGSAAAQDAYRLVHEMELSEVDTWICDHAPPAPQPERDSLSATVKAETPEPPVPPAIDSPEPVMACDDSRAASAAPSVGQLVLSHLPSTTTTSDIRQLAISRGLFFRKVSIQESSTLHEVDVLVHVDSAEGVQRTVAALEGALLGETVLRPDGPAALCAGTHLQDDSHSEQHAAVAAESSSAPAPEAKRLLEAPDAAPPTTSSRAADPSKQNATSSSNSRAFSPAARRDVHAARRMPSPAERRRPQPPRRPLRWAYLSELPLSISERYLFDQLGKQSIVAHDVIVIQRSDKPRRFAFVALMSDVDMRRAIDLFDRRWMDDCMVLAGPCRDKRTGANEPDISRLLGVNHSLRQPYAGSRANAAQEPHPAACKVVIAHLDARATKNDVGDFIERYVGRDSVRTLRLDYAGHNDIEQIAYVEFSRHLDALRAFHGLDGAVLFDHACTVTWGPDASISAASSSPRRASQPSARKRSRSRSRSPFRQRPAPSPQKPALPIVRDSTAASSEALSVAKIATGTTPAPQPAAAALPGRSATQRDPAAPPAVPSAPRPASPAPVVATDAMTQISPTTFLPSPPPDPSPGPAPPATAETGLQRDLSRLRALGYSAAEVEALRRVWEPLDAAPSAGFSRTAELTASFGFLPRREAKAALDANTEQPMYSDEKAMQQRFEAFLRAQAGESRDWYTVFFARLHEFNTTSAMFVETAKRAATDSSS